MKGILYEGFLLNRKWFLAAGIIAALGTLTCAAMIAVSDKDPVLTGTTNVIFIVVLALTTVMCAEWLDRHLESNLKCRFVDVTLAGGISKSGFVMSLMLENLITTAISFLMCLAMNGVMFVTDKAVGGEVPFWDVFYIKLAVLLALFAGIVDFISLPLVIELKSAEKAGLVIGIIFGFGIVLPGMIIYNYLNPEPGKFGVFLEMIYKFLDAPYFYPAVIGAAAVIYAVFYVITLNRVKRGDVC